VADYHHIHSSAVISRRCTTNASCSVEAVATSGRRDAVAAILAYVHTRVSDWEARLDRGYLQDCRPLPLLLILPGAAALSVAFGR
jgi:hypothetical protein